MQDEFDLKQATAKWRHTLLKRLEPEVVEELERHLLDAYERFIHSDHAPREAFEKARGDIGEPTSLQTEFAKIPEATTLHRKTLILLFFVVSALNLAALIGSKVLPFSNDLLSWKEIVQSILSANLIHVVRELKPATLLWLFCYLMVMIRYVRIGTPKKARILCALIGIVGPVLQLGWGQDIGDLLGALLTAFYITVTVPISSAYVLFVGVDGEFFTDSGANAIAYGWWALLWWVLLLRDGHRHRSWNAVREAFRGRFARSL